MTLSGLIKNIVSILNAYTDFPVFEYFPDFPVESRIYSVVEINSVKINRNIRFTQSTGIPISVRIKISLFAPVEFNKSELMEKYEKCIINTMLNSNLRIADISCLKTEINKNLQLSEIYSFINISGIMNSSGGE